MSHYPDNIATLPRVLCTGRRGTAVLVPAAPDAVARFAQCLFYASLELAVAFYRVTEDDEVVLVPPTHTGRTTPTGRRERRGQSVEEA